MASFYQESAAGPSARTGQRRRPSWLPDDVQVLWYKELT